MPPKGKGKKGKKKKKGKKVPLVPPMKNVIRTFYELEIADIQKKIEQLKNCAEENIVLEKEIEYLVENRTDDLGKKYFQLREETSHLEETEDACNKIIKEHADFLEEHHQTILRKDCEFVRMVEEHKVNVRLKKAELIQFEGFAKNGEAMLKRFQNDEIKYLEREAKQKEELLKMDLDLQSYKEQVKQDVDRKLLKLSEEFVGKCKRMIPKHTQRLIHENIALNNELDSINKTNITLQHKLDSVLSVAARKTELQMKNNELVLTCQKNLAKITNLIKSVEEISGSAEYLNIKRVVAAFENKEKLKFQELQNYGFNVNILRRDVHGMTVERNKLKLDLRLQKIKYNEYMENKRKVEWHFEMLKKFDQQDEHFCLYDEQSFQKCTRASVRQQLLDILEQVKYIQDPLVLRIDSVQSITNAYSNDNYGGLLDRDDYDTYDDDVVIQIKSEEEFPRKRSRPIKKEESKIDIIPIGRDIKRVTSILSVHSDIVVDVEVDDTEFFFEPSDAELSELEEEEADEEDFNYSSSD